MLNYITYDVGHKNNDDGILCNKIMSVVLIFTAFLFSGCSALKPTNIYIQSNGSHVVVGDFCLPSVFSDLKTHNRPAIGQSVFSTKVSLFQK